MAINSKTNSVNQDVASLYCLIGEAVYMIQHLEGALSVSITLKKDVQHPHKIPKEEAEDHLKKYQSYPLGKAIQIAKENTLYSDILYSDLKAFLKERNWLVHKLLHQNLDDMNITSSRGRLFRKIKTISSKAKMLQGAIEADLITFSESVGIDMSKVCAYIDEYSNTSENVPSSL